MLQAPTGPRAAKTRVAVIIVAFNSGIVLKHCLEALAAQSLLADKIIVVDNASSDASYLAALPSLPGLNIIRLPSNLGFCGGNNRGYAETCGYEYVLFLNPDAFLEASFIAQAVQAIEHAGREHMGALSGTLLGFDVLTGRPTDKVDSTGIFQTWYGKWFDRGQGQPYPRNAIPSCDVEQVPALCGALMFCRRIALEQVLIRNAEVFDATFFMYKEDIDLSLRLIKAGWTLGYLPLLKCFHGRGWSGRGSMTHTARYLSARNELRISLRNRARGLIYSSLKFLYVVMIESRS